MKARIRHTNIEVDVQPFYDETGYFAGFKDGYEYYRAADLVFPDTPAWDPNIDWSAFRREAAKDILCSVVANPGRIGDVEYGRNDYRQSEYVRFAIDCAEELIKQLKQE